MPRSTRARSSIPASLHADVPARLNAHAARRRARSEPDQRLRLRGERATSSCCCPTSASARATRWSRSCSFRPCRPALLDGAPICVTHGVGERAQPAALICSSGAIGVRADVRRRRTSRSSARARATPTLLIGDSAIDAIERFPAEARLRSRHALARVDRRSRPSSRFGPRAAMSTSAIPTACALACTRSPTPTPGRARTYLERVVALAQRRFRAPRVLSNLLRQAQLHAPRRGAERAGGVLPRAGRDRRDSGTPVRFRRSSVLSLASLLDRAAAGGRLSFDEGVRLYQRGRPPRTRRGGARAPHGDASARRRHLRDRHDDQLHERLQRALHLLRVLPARATQRRLHDVARRGAGARQVRGRSRRDADHDPGRRQSGAAASSGSRRSSSACGASIRRSTSTRSRSRRSSGSRTSRASRRATCSRGCKDAGMKSLPGAGAEILVERVRKRISARKVQAARVARRDARCAAAGHADDRDDDVRLDRDAARTHRAPARAARAARRNRRLHRVHPVVLRSVQDAAARQGGDRVSSTCACSRSRGSTSTTSRTCRPRG